MSLTYLHSAMMRIYNLSYNSFESLWSRSVNVIVHVQDLNRFIFHFEVLIPFFKVNDFMSDLLKLMSQVFGLVSPI